MELQGDGVAERKDLPKKRIRGSDRRVYLRTARMDAEGGYVCTFRVSE